MKSTDLNIVALIVTLFFQMEAGCAHKDDSAVPLEEEDLATAAGAGSIVAHQIRSTSINLVP